MTQTTCPTCGIEFDRGDSTDDGASSLCPACLLAQGLSDDTVPLRCTKCRLSLDYDARFCPHCGTRAPMAAAEDDPIRAAIEAQLGGQYRMVRLLGRGGMGSVYLARDLSLDREVAIKVVKTAGCDRETYDRFHREAKTVARLSHPNVVPLHAFGEVEGMPYFVMGYVRGESLGARLRRDGKLGEGDGLRILAEVADALDHAHRQGVVHRDVKPDNVLLDDESGRALLADFGLAKALGSCETTTLDGGVLGTPHYMSPEQAGGRAVDARSDLYSLGVMAYAVLGGRLPFEGKTAVDVLAQHLTQDPPSLRTLNGKLSDTTVQAVDRCLAKDPRDRWQDARSLRLSLGVDEEPHLPDSLQVAESRGVAIVFFLWMFEVIFGGFLRAEGSSMRERVLIGVGMIGLTIFYYTFFVVRLRRQGIAPARTHRVVWQEPSWWLWWYPRPLRRRGNVWHRLPVSVRLVRHSIAWFLGCIVVLYTVLPFLGGSVVGRFPGGGYPMGTYFVFALFALLVLVWAASTVRTRRQLSRLGLPAEDVNRIMMSMPPSRVAFWNKPHVADVLAPQADSDAHPSADSPHVRFQAILRLADLLGGPLRALGTEAAAAGRQLLTSIEDADREIAELTRSLEAGEQERLTAKLASFPEGETAPLRTLLEKELELVRGLSERVEETKALRSRRVEMLRTLASHLKLLHARSAERADTSGITEQVRELCEDIAARAAA